MTCPWKLLLAVLVMLAIETGGAVGVLHLYHARSAVQK